MSGVVNRKSDKLKKDSKKEKKETNIWNKECEELLAEWSEKASCYRWLHGRCEKSYRTWYYCFSIPVIILSTLTGAANVGMDSFVPQESKSMASAIVGGVNIFAGIVSTLQNFLKVAELMEGHRIAGVSWGKLQRNIAIELALDPDRRVLQGDFLKLSRAEYDRLIEAGPIIDDALIKQFNKKFKNYQVSIPSICNGLDKCKIFKVDNDSLEDKDDGDKYIQDDDLMDGIEDVITSEEKDYIKKEKKKDPQIKVIVDEESDDGDSINDDDSINDVNTSDVIETENLIPPTEIKEDKVTNDKNFQTDIKEEEEEDLTR